MERCEASFGMSRRKRRRKRRRGAGLGAGVGVWVGGWGSVREWVQHPGRATHNRGTKRCAGGPTRRPAHPTSRKHNTKKSLCAAHLFGSASRAEAKALLAALRAPGIRR